MTTDTELTPTQALGVLLSVQAETMTMDEAQDRAPNMLDHLHRLGYDLVSIDLVAAATAFLRDYRELPGMRGSAGTSSEERLADAIGGLR